MKKYVIFIVLLSALNLIAEDVSFDSPMGNFKFSVTESSSKKNSSSVVDEIAKRLDILEKNYCSKLNGFEKKKASKLMNEIYDLLALLPDDVMVTSEVVVEQTQTADTDININFNVNEQVKEPVVQKVEPVMEVESKPVSKAMSESEFQQLKNNIESESFDDDMISVLRIAAKSKFFTIDQVSRLVGVFSFSEEQIEVVRICYPKVVDKGNAHSLLSAFTYSDDKRAVESIINQ